MTNRNGKFRPARGWWMAGVVVGAVGAMATSALSQQEKVPGWSAVKKVIEDTGVVGGVNPTFDDLVAMQKVPKDPGQNYILHCHDGKLTKVPADKTRLPDKPQFDMVEKRIATAPDGTIYFNASTKICKSTDGGRTWTAHPRGTGPDGEEMNGYLEILDDGAFLCIRRKSEGARTDPIPVWTSSDEGRSWKILSKIVMPAKYNKRFPVYGMYRILSNNSLLCIVEGRMGDYRSDTLTSGPLLGFRSTDHGKSWEDPYVMAQWCSEGGIAQLPSGKLLATLRYQPSIAGKVAYAKMQKDGIDMDAVTKMVFLLDSDDQGRTWHNFRQLTSIMGQCYAFPAALRDGTVVVTHDCRFGPYDPSCRALISYDEGQTWEDEAYFISATIGTQHVVLPDDTILSISVTGDKPGGQFEVPHPYLSAIRWKPKPKAKTN